MRVPLDPRSLAGLLILPIGFALPAFAGGPITSGEILAGSVAGPTFMESWTFDGTNGDRVLIGAVTTSGAMNTSITLREPDSTVVVSTSGDLLDYQLPATGTFTIEIRDLGLNDPGTYNVSLLNVTAGSLTSASDLDGGAIASAERMTGTFDLVADLDAFTFSGTAGERVLFTAVATGGGLHNTVIYLYPPGGGVREFDSVAGDRLDHALAQTGTYTLVILDLNLDHTGAYNTSFLNLTAGPLTSESDPDGGPIASAEIMTGQMHVAGDFDAFQFIGTSGDRVLIGALATSDTLNTNVRLYPPNGAAVVTTSADLVDYRLLATGAYTIVIEDLGLDKNGDFSLSVLNVTAGPLTSASDPDGGAIVSAESSAGTFGPVADFDAFTFPGVAGERVLFTAVATGGGSHNTVIYLYPPGGGAREVGVGTVDRLDHTLVQTGTYTVVILDSDLDHTGAYGVSFLNLTAGPLTSAADLDGGWLVSGDLRSGQITPVPDLDGYQFGGAAGDTAWITAVATSGTLNTRIYLYPPGGPAVVETPSDNVTYVLSTGGTYALVIEDSGLKDTGEYNLAFTKSGETTAIGDSFAPLDPARVVMLPAYPIPFTRAATLTFSLPAECRVQLRVYDVRGALVRTIVEGSLAAGVHRFAWDARNDRGVHAGPGVYYSELRAGPELLRGKLVHVR